jgi:acid phosphatase
MRKMLLATTLVAGFAALLPHAVAAEGQAKKLTGINKIGHIVVIYMENRSFDTEYGYFPGANGFVGLDAPQFKQIDRDGTTVMPVLPATWGGVIDSHQLGQPAPYPQLTQIPQSATTNMKNRPFTINAADQFDLPASVATRDLYHRFFENQMQIHGGKNDMFAAWADGGGITMGHYRSDTNGKATERPLYNLARKFVLADNFFQSAFGGSYLNHQFLICSCANTLTPAQQTRPTVDGTGMVIVPVSVLNADGVTLTTASNSPASALDGPPVYVASTTLTPLDTTNNVYYGVNTMQPPYPPSGNGVGLPQTSVNMDATTTVPPQTATTIGDLMTNASVDWAWYAGAMQYAIDNGTYNGAAGKDARANLVPDFQPHHNPFNYYASFAPGTAQRTAHLRDGGLNGTAFLADVDAGTLPAVTFYKPQGNLNQHTGYTDINTSESYAYDLIVNHLMKSPQYKDMVIVLTYDENGGWWDHVAPPKGDQFGPGTRIPALIISPFAKKGTVDHTQYDTTSILRLITHRYSLPVLPGITLRDTSLVNNGGVAMGDLTGALNLN